jgi:diguanylate cyclase (GGDEF)-like protein/PAS domain S-box-containing protein
MPPPFAFLRPLFTLKSRVAISAAALFGGVSLVLLLFQLHETRASMTQMVAAQQTTLVTRAAAEIDEKFAARRTALEVVARDIAARGPVSPHSAPGELLRYPALASLFDHVFIFAGDGQVQATNMPEAVLMNAGQRPYFTDTVQSGRGVISAPYRGLATGRPYVMMTMPITDDHGRVAAVLTGSIDLLKPNFIGEIGTTPVGRSGYFYIVTSGANPTVVSHPNPRLILGPVRGHGPGNAAARALDGFEGTTEGVNSSGITGLMSFKRLRQTGWILAAVLPTDEAFAPIARSQRNTLAAGAAAVLAIALAVWVLVRRALRPIEALRDNVLRRIDDPGIAALPELRADEIGDLTGAFNRLMAAQAAAKQALAANEERLRTITDNLPVLVGYLDRDLRYRFANHAYQEWFGIKASELIGRSVRKVLGEENYAAALPDLQQALQGYSAVYEREHFSAGRRRHIEATYLPHYGAAQEVIGVYVLITDITEHKLAQERLQYLAHHDPLTGLLNRAAFGERLRLSLQRQMRSGKPCALMYLDIDKFKSINDTRGHGAGDCLLRGFAARLTGAVRQTDIVGRLGGDEFVVLAEDLAAEDDACLVAQKIVDAMRLPFDIGDQPLLATASIGVALGDCESAAGGGPALLELADRALYEAKAAGRNTFRMLVPA